MNGPCARVAAVVNRVGDELLAGAVLALDQHVGVAGRHGIDELEQRQHGLALADDVLERVLLTHPLLQPQMLPALLHQVGGAIEEPEQPLGVEIRLLDEVEGACLAGLQRALDGALSADDDHLEALVDGLQRPQHVDAVGVGQHQVEEDHGRLMRPAGLLRPEPGVRRGHPVAGHARRVADHRLQELDRSGVVIHDEDGRFHAGARFSGTFCRHSECLKTIQLYHFHPRRLSGRRFPGPGPI